MTLKALRYEIRNPASFITYYLLSAKEQLLRSVAVLQRQHLKYLLSREANNLSVTAACFIDLNGPNVSVSMRNTAHLTQMAHEDISLTAASSLFESTYTFLSSTYLLLTCYCHYYHFCWSDS